MGLQNIYNLIIRSWERYYGEQIGTDVVRKGQAYEDNVLGRIPDEQYRLLSRDYTKEQTEIDETLPKVTEQLQKLKDSAGNVSRFLENAQRYTEIQELTCEILHTFIQRVEVGERAKRYDRNAPQEIRIYYRDIGLIDKTPETMTAEKEKPTQTEVA